MSFHFGSFETHDGRLIRESEDRLMRLESEAELHGRENERLSTDIQQARRDIADLRRSLRNARDSSNGLEDDDFLPAPLLLRTIAAVILLALCLFSLFHPGTMTLPNRLGVGFFTLLLVVLLVVDIRTSIRLPRARTRIREGVASIEASARKDREPRAPPFSAFLTLPIGPPSAPSEFPLPKTVPPGKRNELHLQKTVPLLPRSRLFSQKTLTLVSGNRLFSKKTLTLGQRRGLFSQKTLTLDRRKGLFSEKTPAPEQRNGLFSEKMPARDGRNGLLREKTPPPGTRKGLFLRKTPPLHLGNRLLPAKTSPRVAEDGRRSSFCGHEERTDPRRIAEANRCGMTNPFEIDPHVQPLPILLAPDPRLRERSAEMSADDPALIADGAALVATLRDFRARCGFGRAISAVQVGVMKRLVAMDLGSGPFLLVNPEITWRSEETFLVWDDCLSIPDVLVRVRRNRSVSLSYLDPQFRPREWNDMPPNLSELIQHEVDHLDGVLMTDRAEGEDAVQPMCRRAELVRSGDDGAGRRS